MPIKRMQEKQTNNSNEILGKVLKQLQEVTKDCREDMHEPDEQGIDAMVTGYNLDNAMGWDPHTNCGEFTVGILKTEPGDDEEIVTWFNLADLIALARKAVL